MSKGVRSQLASRQRQPREGYRLVRPAKGSGTAIQTICEVTQQFRVKSQIGDYLICRSWDGTTEGTVDVKVAKPYLTRQSPFDSDDPYNAPPRNSVEVSHKFSGAASIPEKREARSGFSAEIQQIVPGYMVNDIIYATKHINGGAIVEKSNGTPPEAITACTPWIDDNRDARQFLKKKA